MTSRIVICIPINLKKRKDIAAALENNYGTEYVLTGRMLRSTINNDSCEIDFRTLNGGSNFIKDFELAGQNKLYAATIQQIDICQQVIYLSSSDTGYDACLKIARLAQVMLQVGGIAIKVESAGMAHNKVKWLANYNSDDVFEIYSLFVTLVEGDDSYYSCGMHNFGKADVAIDLAVDIGLAIYVMNVFNYYRLTESPILQDGHTFQPDIECPKYKIKWTTDRETEINSPQYNSHGRWHLKVSS